MLTEQSPPLDTSPATFPSKDIHLTGTHVTITSLQTTHAAALYEQTSGPENNSLWTHLFSGPYTSLTSFEIDTESAISNPSTIFYTILLNHPSTPVGRAALMRIDLPNRVCEIGHVLFSPLLQRTRAATEALYLLGCYVFETLRFRRWEWKCNSLNRPSERAATRFGFGYEGCFRQHMFQRGASRDTSWFSMLDGEWPDRKREMELWLREENFDERGVQKMRLEEFRVARG